MKKEGKYKYFSMEKGWRYYISSCWYHIKKELKQGYEEINFKLENDMKLKELTEIYLERKARRILIERCFE